MYVFSYGSNLNVNRMNERGVKFSKIIPVILKDFILKFNKVSKKQGAVANIQFYKGGIVEGVLYEVESLEQLDKYEGYPKHYNRVLIKIDEYDAWVYVAQPEYIQEGLQPKQEYLNHLLEGKQYLSEEYYENLKLIIK